MTPHPQNNDRFRTFIAENRFSVLLLYYLFLNVLVCTAFAALVVVSEAIAGKAYEGIFPEAFLECLYILFGQSPVRYLTAGSGFNAILYALLSLFSVLLPGLLLGSILFKLTAPTRNLAIFSDKLEVDTATGALETSFYLATTMSVYEMQTRVFVKYYRKERSESVDDKYPLKSFQIHELNGDHYIALPYAPVPTRVSVPVAVLRDETHVREDQDLTVVIADGRVDWYVRGQPIRPKEGDLARLIVLVDGHLPGLLTQLYEHQTFDLCRDARIGITKRFRSYYNPARDRYEITKWENF